MTLESKRSSKDIFLQAIEISSQEERAAFLAEACIKDSDLRNRVDALILAHDRPESLLNSSAPRFGADGPDLTVALHSAEKPGTMIGPYKLLQQIGEGGMGTVYMAEQTAPIKRRVALKVIKPGMDSKQVLARFEAERQALALMDHPNIAKVHEAGTTDAGLPFFVMELVKGVPITQFCDDNRLSTKQRLQLFVDVCKAVQHAHQKGVIHRDLKPSNVLVAKFDDHPVVKVIDFGVAKATNQELTERTMFTQFGQIVGTLEYMSPEQAHFNQLDIDTRSDIYSLGVLLYELLTGAPPFDRERLRNAAFDEVIRIIREEEPPRPSARLSTLGKDAEMVSSSRRADVSTLGRLVRGDVDLIVMKAMEKDRSRRYESASGLAADLQRYLDDEPIEARPQSTSYRMRKFVGRYRVVVTTGALVFLTLLLGLIGAIWTGQRLQRVNEKNRELISGLIDVLFEQGLTEVLRGDNSAAQETIGHLRENAAADLAIQLDAFREIQLGNIEEAIEMIRPLAEKYPESIPCHAILATAYDRMGDYELTIEHENALDRLKPDGERDLLFLSLASQTGRVDSYQINQLTETQFRRLRSPVLLLMRATRRANEAFEKDEPQLAIQALEENNAARLLLGLEGADARSLILRTCIVATKTLEGTGSDFDKAKQELDALVSKLETNPIQNATYLERSYLACYHFCEGNSEKAFELHEKDALEGQDLPILSYLALAAEMGHHFPRAFLDKTIKEQSGPVTRLAVGLTLTLQGDAKAAVSLYGKDNSVWELTHRLAFMLANGEHELAQQDAASKIPSLRANGSNDYFSSLYKEIFIPAIAEGWPDPKLIAAAKSFADAKIAVSHAHFLLGQKYLGMLQYETAAKHFRASAETGPIWDSITIWARAFAERCEQRAAEQ